MGESLLMAAARAWVADRYPYNSEHLLGALAWLDRIAPDAPESVRLATLTHDMDRAFPGPDQPISTRLSDSSYEQAHADRSARIVAAWLRGQGADERLTADVETLVRAHEVGGSPEADLVQAADSLSFLDTNVDLFLGFVRAGRFPADDVRRKFERMRDRVRLPHLRAMAEPMAARAVLRLDRMAADRTA
jgi:hypothetical protein